MNARTSLVIVFALWLPTVVLSGPVATAGTVLLQDFSVVPTGAVAVSSAISREQPSDIGFVQSGYARGGQGTWSPTMVVLSSSVVELEGQPSEAWFVEGASVATTTEGRLRVRGQATWNLADTDGTLTSSLAAGLWYRSNQGTFLDLADITGVELRGSGSSALGMAFTLVLARSFGLPEQQTAVAQYVVAPGQSLSSVGLDFSQLNFIPDADGDVVSLATATDLVIEVKYLFSAGPAAATGSFEGNYDIAQVVLVPSPGAAILAALAGCLRPRRRA